MVRAIFRKIFEKDVDQYLANNSPPILTLASQLVISSLIACYLSSSAGGRALTRGASLFSESSESSLKIPFYSSNSSTK